MGLARDQRPAQRPWTPPPSTDNWQNQLAPIVGDACLPAVTHVDSFYQHRKEKA